MTTLRGIPRHKYVPVNNTCALLVDAFSYAAKASGQVMYFLTHAHADHYTGIRSNWNAGPIYCSEVTGSLVHHLLQVKEDHIVKLPMNTELSLSFGIKVTLISANHCPGAVIFLFQLPNGERVIHTGDFRFDPSSMASSQHLLQFRGAQAIYLDTTYCNPKHNFPKQEDSISYIIDTILSCHEANEVEGGRLKTLFLISTYVIGKEKILEEIYKTTGSKIYVNQRKSGVLECLGLDVQKQFTTDPTETPYHVVSWNFLGETWPYFRPNYVKAKEYMEEYCVNNIVGFVPTGWVAPKHSQVGNNKVVSKEGIKIHLVPYSEHSSFDELISFVKLIKPQKVGCACALLMHFPINFNLSCCAGYSNSRCL